MRYRRVYCKEDHIVMIINKPLIFKKGRKYFVLPCSKGPYKWSYHHIMGESEKCVIILDEENVYYSPITLSQFYDIFEYGGKFTRFLRILSDKFHKSIIMKCYIDSKYYHPPEDDDITFNYKRNKVCYKIYPSKRKLIRVGTYRKEKYIFGGK